MADLRSYFQGVDLDSGGGTDFLLGVSLRLSASGGAIEAIGQQTMASSIPVAIASNQSAVSVDTELPTAAALADGAANPTTALVGACLQTFNGTTWDRAQSVSNGMDDTGPGVLAAGIVGQLDDTGTGAVTENQFAPVRISTRRALLVEGVASGTAISVSVSGAVDTELPAAAALADATANPTVPAVGTFLHGYNGTTWDRVRTANTGRLQVDVITGGGTDTPANPVTQYVTSAAVAAGATASLDTPEAASKKLRAVHVWATVAFKAMVHTVDNAVESTNPKAVGGGQAFQTCQIEIPHRNYLTLGATAGLDAFRVKFTNLDDANAADAYACFYYED